MDSSYKNVLRERWDQPMIGGLTNLHMDWMDKTAVIGCTRLFVTQITFCYEIFVDTGDLHLYQQLKSLKKKLVNTSTKCEWLS